MWKIKIYIVSRGKSAGRQTKREREGATEELAGCQACSPDSACDSICLTVCLSGRGAESLAKSVTDSGASPTEYVTASDACSAVLVPFELQDLRMKIPIKLDNK